MQTFFLQTVRSLGCDGGLVLLFVFPKLSEAKRTGSSHSEQKGSEKNQQEGKLQVHRAKGKQTNIAGERIPLQIRQQDATRSHNRRSHFVTCVKLLHFVLHCQRIFIYFFNLDLFVVRYRFWNGPKTFKKMNGMTDFFLAIW